MRKIILALAALASFATPAFAVDYTKNIVTDYGAVCNARSVTIDIASSTFTAPNHGMSNGRGLHFFTTGSAPTGMTATATGQDPGAPVYYTHNVTANTFQIKTTATGTTPITLSGTQSGTFTFDTDSRPEFESFNTWAKTVTTDTNTITLNIPTGSDCVMMTGYTTMPTGRVGLGLKKFVMNGNGSIFESYAPSTTGVIFALGGGGIYQDNTHGARLNYVAKGSTSVTAMNPAEVTSARGFVVGRWITVSGIEMQAAGFPQNPYYFEYAKITSVNYTTGEVGIDRATKRYYKTTWPHYSSGSASAPNYGGYAYAYTMYPEWDVDLTYNDLQIRQYFKPTDSAAATGSGSARKVTLNNITILDGGVKNTSGASMRGLDACVAPTTALEIIYNNVQAPLCVDAEADKMTEYWLIKDSLIQGVGFQSSSFRVVDIDHSNIGQIGGTPQILNIKNGSVIGGVFNGVTGYGLKVGSGQYGRTEQVNCNNSTIYNVLSGGVSENVLKANNGISMSGGLITINKAQHLAVNEPTVRWAVPETNLTFTAVNPGVPDYAIQSFHIVDIWDDATNIYIQTDKTGGFPAPQIPNYLPIAVHQAPSMLFRNCTGSNIALELSKAPSAVPYASYINRTFTADKMAQANSLVGPFWGKITSMKTNVIKAYLGSTSAPNFFVRPLGVGGWNFIDTAGTSKTFTPTIDGKVEGLRTILPAPATPKPTDSFPALSISPPYYTQNGYNIGSQTKSPTMLPIVQLEVQTDQNIMKPGN